VTHVVLVERHSESSYYFFGFISNYLALSSINIINGIVEVLEFEFETDESLD
jgi:hypothetical protein